ncbi:dihydroneopterin aldolase [Spongiibacter sp. KMU-158]|uniref:7,8-dihydroneopterin aldolase n=1 Tax=Spongiibacter pelagi TaxID=2760804 RepID=A0A927BZS5_9GAMM|nr:dihydroneopterin aldolase [Spongiibacter pelagi]MBD2858614.1 dihydroneopterin aldolase [Spongiibacter pelagi]
MDIVFIEALKIDTLIGIHPWEREQRQPVLLDLDMAWDNRPAAQSDDIAKTLNYQAVSERLLEFVGASEFLLVETLAEQCAELVMREFGVSWLRLKLRKPQAIAEAAAVGVEIQRGRRPE